MNVLTPRCTSLFTGPTSIDCLAADPPCAVSPPQTLHQPSTSTSHQYSSCQARHRFRTRAKLLGKSETLEVLMGLNSLQSKPTQKGSCFIEETSTHKRVIITFCKKPRRAGFQCCETFLATTSFGTKLDRTILVIGMNQRHSTFMNRLFIRNVARHPHPAQKNP